MVLDAVGIKVPLWRIAMHVWKKWYGTPPQLMVAYLVKYFCKLGYAEEENIKDIKWHLKVGHIVIVNWTDKGEGHYSIIGEYDGGLLTMVDSSREHTWCYFMEDNIFEQNWYDCLASDGRLRHDGLLIWIDPKSVKKEFVK